MASKGTRKQDTRGRGGWNPRAAKSSATSELTEGGGKPSRASQRVLKSTAERDSAALERLAKR